MKGRHRGTWEYRMCDLRNRDLHAHVFRYLSCHRGSVAVLLWTGMLNSMIWLSLCLDVVCWIVFANISASITARACVWSRFLTLQSPLVTLFTAGLNIQKFYLLLTLCICFLCMSEYTALNSVYSITWFVCMCYTEYVYCTVNTEALNIIIIIIIIIMIKSIVPSRNIGCLWVLSTSVYRLLRTLVHSSFYPLPWIPIFSSYFSVFLSSCFLEGSKVVHSFVSLHPLFLMCD